MKRILYLLILVTQTSLAQQQITFSQYMFNGLLVNPAYASSDEAFNLTFMQRKQWSSVKGAPEVQGIMAHKYYDKKRMGVGGIIENFSYGVTKIVSVNGIYSYTIKMPQGRGRYNKFSMGLRMGVSSFKQNLTDLVLPQLSGGVQDPSFDHNSSKMIFNMSAGVNYEARKFYAGLTIAGLVSNKLDKDNTLLAKQIPHYFLTGGYLFDISRDVKVRTQVLMKATTGAPLSTDVNIAALLKEVVWVGFTYKYDNSVNGLLEFKVKQNFKIGFAYDIVYSSLSRVTPGTYEISLNYRYLKKNSRRIMSPRYF